MQSRLHYSHARAPIADAQASLVFLERFLDEEGEYERCGEAGDAAKREGHGETRQLGKDGEADGGEGINSFRENQDWEARNGRTESPLLRFDDPTRLRTPTKSKAEL